MDDDNVRLGRLTIKPFTVQEEFIRRGSNEEVDDNEGMVVLPLYNRGNEGRHEAEDESGNDDENIVR
jgi:hypothetical protein